MFRKLLRNLDFLLVMAILIFLHYEKAQSSNEIVQAIYDSSSAIFVMVAGVYFMVKSIRW